MRIAEIVLCAVAGLIPIIRKGAMQPYSLWCEFVWAFGLGLAIVILVLEFLLLHLVVSVFLEHSWDDLATGLTLICSAMLLSATLIYPMRVMHCKLCIFELLATVVSCVATLVFFVDAGVQKIKMSGGYLTAVRGILRSSEALFSCLLLTAFASYFLGVGSGIPFVMVWCMLVYLVCFVLSLLMMLFNLVKLLKMLICVDKLEVIFNIVAVVLYSTVMILWPIFGKLHYFTLLKWDSDTRSEPNYGYRYRDLIVVSIMTGVNLLLYVVDLILSLKTMYNR